MHRRSAPRRFLSNNVRPIEELETRAMLSGHAIASAFISSHQSQSISAAAAHIPSAVSSSVSSAPTAVFDHLFANLGRNFGGEHAQTVLAAQLTDSAGTATGSARLSTSTYDGATLTKLNVNITGAAADTTFDVLVGTTVAGQVTTDASGNASVVFSSDPKGSQQAFLAVPTAASGDTVAIGTLSGALATPTFSGGCGEHSATRFAATLTDSAGSATGSVKLSTYTEDGATETKLTVKITGATPLTTFDVLVGTTLAGQVTTDDAGSASAVFSSNPTGTQLPFLTIPTGSGGLAVTIGTLSGSLAAVAHGHRGHR
jgi:hypothetical protein